MVGGDARQSGGWLGLSTIPYMGASQKFRRSAIAKPLTGTYVHPMPMKHVPDLGSLSLSEIVKLMEERKLPPVASWNPEHCGHSDMRIAADGTWFHQGSPIGRQEMVRLFSTILRREPDGGYVLVTPVEKLTIDVEDAPFIAVELRRDGDGRGASLTFRLNTGDFVIAGAEHPITLRDTENGPRPYIAVRSGLDAVIARPVYYELANLAIAETDRPDDANGSGIWSEGMFFPMTTDGDAADPSGHAAE